VDSMKVERGIDIEAGDARGDVEGTGGAEVPVVELAADLAETEQGRRPVGGKFEAGDREVRGLEARELEVHVTLEGPRVGPPRGGFGRRLGRFAAGQGRAEAERVDRRR